MDRKVLLVTDGNIACVQVLILQIHKLALHFNLSEKELVSAWAVIQDITAAWSMDGY